MKELDLTDAFIAAVPFRFGSRVRAFRRQIVNAMVEKGGRYFAARAGVKGQADVYCLVQGGLHIEVELKAARGVLSAEQKAWRQLMDDMKIPYLCPRARVGEEPAATADRWCDELDQKIKEWKP